MKKKQGHFFLEKRTKRLLVLVAAVGCSPACAQLPSIQFQPPARDFGYLVGDVFTTDTTIIAWPGAVLDRLSLPVPGPLNAAIELRRINADEMHRNDSTKIRLHLEYQTFLAPDRVTQVELPGFAVHLATGPVRSTAQIPAWLFHVSPLRVTQRSVENLPDLRANRAIDPLPTFRLVAWLIGSLAVAAAAAMMFAQGRGWLPGLHSGTRPFASAARRIGRLGGAEKEHEEAYRELHRAFDATAGHNVFAEDLGAFLSMYPRFASLQAEIERFFVVSENRFFARSDASKRPVCNLVKLAKSLRRLERRR